MCQSNHAADDMLGDDSVLASGVNVDGNAELRADVHGNVVESHTMAGDNAEGACRRG